MLYNPNFPERIQYLNIMHCKGKHCANIYHLNWFLAVNVLNMNILFHSSQNGFS